MVCDIDAVEIIAYPYPVAVRSVFDIMDVFFELGNIATGRPKMNVRNWQDFKSFTSC